MKTTLPLAAVLLALSLGWIHAQTPLPTAPGMPAGMTGGYETLQSKILKVYSAEDNGAKHRAYVVNWKDQEVVVSDPMGTTTKKVGDDLTFLAQRIEMPVGGKTIKLLQFMAMEIPSIPTSN